MKSILRALAFCGILGLAAAAAQAQVVVGFRAPRAAVVVAVPPCPGVGYVWTPGYYAGAVWVPGSWIYRGYGHPVVRAYPHDFYRPAYRVPYRR